MSEFNKRSEQPDGYIVDSNVALEVAYSAKGYRDIAAASRTVESILNDNAKESVNDGMQLRLLRAGRLMAAYAIYPESFSKLVKGKEIDDEAMYKLVPYITKIGGLPTEASPCGKKYDSEILDSKAEIRESIAEALVVNPPNQDFLRDFDLGDRVPLGSKDKGYEYRVNVEGVAELLDSIDIIDDNIKRTNVEARAWDRMYEEASVSSGDGSNKLQRVMNMFRRVDIYLLSYTEERTDFESQVLEATNTETTTIADLKALYDKGVVAALDAMNKRRKEKQAAYNAVISGDASSHVSSKAVN